jgi:hypothetical protein
MELCCDLSFKYAWVSSAGWGDSGQVIGLKCLLCKSIYYFSQIGVSSGPSVQPAAFRTETRTPGVINNQTGKAHEEITICGHIFIPGSRCLQLRAGADSRQQPGRKSG